ncbi:pilus assembly protein PilM [Pragia fontium]|uniref:pilus assembly protein PilM n=1 Tax=Pragia fontium TaxID=82985 RepID=UPI00064ACD11|nr:pilus assembly protein PilM [Pragia fontium]AKJ40896.1 hypothetical protein QQ39_01380 [Pragia fontium]
MQVWQVGLDIQENGFYSLAVQRQRYGWQLRHWGYQPIATVQNQGASSVIPQQVISALTQWRQKLPKRVSVRMALPAGSILQQSIPMPAPPLSLQEQSWLVDASLNKLFPLAAKELAIDYRVLDYPESAGRVNQSIVVSAARRSEVDGWLQALAEADIFPEIIDTAPCVLRSMAQLAGVADNSLLFHQLPRQFLLVSPLEHAFLYRLMPNELMTCAERIESARQLYLLAGGERVQQVCYSGVDDGEGLPPSVDYWSPLVAIRQMSPPLPDTPHQWVLACGLALRQEDL